MATLAQQISFNAEGKAVDSGTFYLPQYLDWMPIEVKAHWMRVMEKGHSDTKYLLLKSQGEQMLLTDVSLRRLTHAEYKEQVNGAEAKVQRFIEERGISRTPRNQ